VKRGSVVSDNGSGQSDKVRGDAANTTSSRPLPTSNDGQKSHSAGKNDRKESGELRRIVARRFMRMLRTHDRVRVKLLATHQPEVR
jgi:hypothetical protein